MSVVYSQNFDGLSTGDLNGQDSWIGNTNFDVENSVSQTAPNAVQAPNNLNGLSIIRTFTTISSGNPVLTVYVQNNTSGVQAAYTCFTDIAGNGWIVNFRPNQTFLMADFPGFGNFIDNQFSWTAGVFYQLTIEVDIANSRARFKIDNGTFSSYVAAGVGFLGSISTVFFLQGANNAGISYWDTLVVDDGAAPPGPTNVKTWDGITQSTGIKTYIGVALASTKTVDGIN